MECVEKEMEQTIKKEDNEMKGNYDNRLFLDVTKGVAVFLMLWGHSIQYCSNGEFDFFKNVVFKFIYSFHMPLFMLISGYLFYFSCKKRELKPLLIHRTQALLQPIGCCTILNYFLTTGILNHNLFTIGGQWINHLGELWFLWSVLAASLVIGFAVKISTKRYFQVTIVVLGLGFVCLFPNWEMNLFMYPYFVVGFIFAKYKDSISKFVIRLKYISLAVFPIMFMFYDKRHYIYTSGIVSSDSIYEVLLIDGYRWAIGFVGSVFALVVLDILFKLFYKWQRIVKPISVLGKYSLQIYAVSFSVLNFWLPKLYGKVCVMLGCSVYSINEIVFNYGFTIFVAIVYAIAILCFVKILERIKVNKLIFGR